MIYTCFLPVVALISSSDACVCGGGGKHVKAKRKHKKGSERLGKNTTKYIPCGLAEQKKQKLTKPVSFFGSEATPRDASVGWPFLGVDLLQVLLQLFT